MSYSFSEELTFESVLRHISQETIYSSYVGEGIKEDKKFRSVFRSNDSVPSLSFYMNEKGRIMYNDFGMNYGAGNVFSFVRTLYNLKTDWEAVVQINHDFNLGLMNMSTVVPRKTLISNILEFKGKIIHTEKILSYKQKQFTNRDLFYWNKFNVDLSILLKYNVQAADIVYINHLPVWFYEITNPIYGYIFPNNQYKFYRPLNWNKDSKFLSSKNIGNVYAGYDQLSRNGKTLIITKAMKDVMTLHSLGYHAIAPNGETYTINPKLISELKIRFDRIFLMLDNDWHKLPENNTGINAMKKICQTYENITPIIIPDRLKCTDIAEVMENYGVKLTTNYLKDETKEQFNIRSWR